MWSMHVGCVRMKRRGGEEEVEVVFDK